MAPTPQHTHAHNPLHTTTKLFLRCDSSPNFNPNIWKLLIQKLSPLATFISCTSRRRGTHIYTHTAQLEMKAPSVWQQQTNTQVVNSIMYAQQISEVPVLCYIGCSTLTNTQTDWKQRTFVCACMQTKISDGSVELSENRNGAKTCKLQVNWEVHVCMLTVPNQGKASWPFETQQPQGTIVFERHRLLRRIMLVIISKNECGKICFNCKYIMKLFSL